MYRSFYGLEHKPFQIASDPKFLWLGEKHKEALAVLQYGIVDNRGFLLLTGDVGTGKTTLINSLVNSMGPDTIVAHVPDPGLALIDFFNYIASAFKMPASFETKGEFLIAFRDFLEKAYTNRRQVLLIIDEAQRLGAALLEEIRLLSNIEYQQTKLINIFFVGQDEFNDILSLPENRALRQRMTLNYHIEPLSEAETAQFVQFRLKVAGTEKKLFSAAALAEVYAFSGGYPRLINIVCDHALLTGYVRSNAAISAEVIVECARELRLPKRQAGLPRAPDSAAAAPQPPAFPVKTPPRRSPSRSLWPIIILFFVLLFLALGWLFPLEQGRVWQSLHRGIDRLAFIVTGDDQRRASPPPVADEARGAPGPAPPVAPASSPPAASQSGSPLRPPARQNPVLPVKSSPALTPQEHGQQSPLTFPELPGQLDPPAAAAQTGSSLSDPRVTVPYPVPRIPAPVAPPRVVTDIDSPLTLRFGYNSNDLSAEGYEKLNQLGDYLIGVPDATIAIKGYTDNVGSYGYNLSLSKFRANIIKNYLLGRGVAIHRMMALGLGSQDPLEPNDTAAGRYMNRRVEIEITKP